MYRERDVYTHTYIYIYIYTYIYIYIYGWLLFMFLVCIGLSTFIYWLFGGGGIPAIIHVCLMLLCMHCVDYVCMVCLPAIVVMFV